MSHSPEHMRQKAEARKEAMDHYNNANVMMPRNGMDHESHKFAVPVHSVDGRPDEFRGKGYNRQSPAQEKAENGYPVKIGESC